MKIIRPVTVAQTGSFTRATTGTYIDSAGVLQTAAINVPRFNYNPVNLAAGPVLLLEAAATNILLNSAVVATQNITVGAGTYVLAFNGTGSITYSGVAAGTLAGTSAIARVSKAIVVTAGTLTLTVTGSCTYGQLETGAAATSYIATAGASASRSADVNTAVLVSNVPENDFAVWSSATAYAIGAKVLDLASHKIYQCIAAHTNQVVTNTTYWVDAGSDNRWKMFDQSITSQTSQATDVTIAFKPGERFDSIIGLNLTGSSATINVVDPTAGVVFSRIVNLVSDSGIIDWFNYYYEPIVQITEFSVLDIPVSYTGVTVTVSIKGTTAAIGGLVFGLSKEIGTTEWGAKIGIVDYSVKTKDAFGNYVITPRAFSKRADFTIQVETSTVDYLQTLLAQYRSVPVVYIGSNRTGTQYNSTIIYGYYKDFSIDIAYASLSVCSLQVEGLT